MSEKHKTTVEPIRYRVTCDKCPWFVVRIGMKPDDLREIGRGHEINMRQEPQK